MDDIGPNNDKGGGSHKKSEFTEFNIDQDISQGESEFIDKEK